eukprot:221365_1
MGSYWSYEAPAQAVVGPNEHVYGWRKDKQDPRDRTYSVGFHHLSAAAKVKKLDLRKQCPKVYNQGKLGSCTANAIGGGFEFELLRQDLKDFTPSRLFIYYNERKMEDSVDQDAGAEIRDGIKSINLQGVCHEDDWPYDIAKFTAEPTRECYLSAKGNRCLKYERVSQKVDHLKAVLCEEKKPIVFGFLVHESFESEEVAKTGEMPMPGDEGSDPVLGGHAVAVVGFDDEKKVFIIRNSWGPEWGAEGYFYMPYAFIAKPEECSDFWCVTFVEEDNMTKPDA